MGLPRGGLILLAHQIHMAISEQSILPALSRKLLALPRLNASISPISISIPEALGLDWPAVAKIQAEQYEKQVKPLLESNPTYNLCYFGTAPIPLAIHLGHQVGTWANVEVFLHRHENKSWRWPDRSSVRSPKVRLSGLPRTRSNITGDAVIRVSTSHQISSSDTIDMVSNPVAEIDISLARPHEDALAAPKDLHATAEAFKVALDTLSQLRPNTQIVHVFAATPVGLAFRLGTRISSTIHPSIQTYQYSMQSSPRYRPALLLCKSSQGSSCPEQARATTLDAVGRALERNASLDELNREMLQTIGTYYEVFGDTCFTANVGFVKNLWNLARASGLSAQMQTAHERNVKRAVPDFQDLYEQELLNLALRRIPERNTGVALNICSYFWLDLNVAHEEAKAERQPDPMIARSILSFLRSNFHHASMETFRIARPRVVAKPVGEPSRVQMPARCDILLIAAVDNEFTKDVRDVFGAKQVPPSPKTVTTMYEASIGTRFSTTYSLRLMCVGRKNASNMAASLVQAVQANRPRYVVMFGIAAIIPSQSGAKGANRRSKGDILVAENVVAIPEFRITPKGALPRPERIIPGGKEFISLAKQEFGQRKEIVFGDIVSQPHLSASKTYRDALVQHVEGFTNKKGSVIGVEMEGGGAGAALDSIHRSEQPGFILIKGGVDWANYHKTKGLQKPVALKVARLIRDLLVRGPIG